MPMRGSAVPARHSETLLRVAMGRSAVGTCPTYPALEGTLSTGSRSIFWDSVGLRRRLARSAFRSAAPGRRACDCEWDLGVRRPSEVWHGSSPKESFDGGGVGGPGLEEDRSRDLAGGIAKYERDDDDVVERSDDRNELGDEVDR